MSDLKNKIVNRWRLIVGLSLFFIVALIIQDFVREIVIFNKDIQAFQDELYSDVEVYVKGLVTSTDDEISYIIDNENTDVVNHAKENVSALIISANAYYSLNPTLPTADLENDIVSLTSYYNEDDTGHLYYVYDKNGTMYYNGLSDTITNVDVYNQTDYYSRPYIKILTDALGDGTTTETSVNFFKEENGSIEEYYIYATTIEHTDLIVASYVNVSTFVSKEKNDFIEHLKYYNDQSVNQVYLISGDGEILFHQNPDAIGRKVTDTEYPVWSQTLQAILDFVHTNDEGYLNYNFYTDYQNGIIKEKVAYVKYIPEWDVIIGASSDTDIYNAVFDNYRNGNYQAVLFIKLPSYFIILSLSVLIFMFIRKNVSLTQRMLIEEETLYRKFADLTSEIIMITDKQGKIIFTNRNGTINIFGQRDNNEDVYFDQILIEEDGYYILYGIKQDMFVKYITEEVEFNNAPADLYIIKDVTDKIQTERKLEALSMKDELTGLGNRRMMVKDYNEEILPYVKNGGVAHLAMLDLDNFKPANDTYGHSFGDTVLQEIAQIFSEVASKTVKFYRIGGDEFAMLFLDHSEQDIRDVLTALQNNIQKHQYDKDIGISFSAGVVGIDITEKRRRFSDFYDRADKLLYKSKSEGKNTINF